MSEVEKKGAPGRPLNPPKTPPDTPPTVIKHTGLEPGGGDPRNGGGKARPDGGRRTAEGGSR